MPAITSANVIEAIPKIIAAEVLSALQPNFVMANLVNRNYSSAIAQAGDTVSVPIPPVMSSQNLLEGATWSPQNPSLGNAQIVLDTHVVSGFSIPDVTAAVAQPNLMRVYMQPAVIKIATQIETDLISQAALFTYNAAVGSTTPMDEARIDAAETQLFQAYVPVTQQKYMVVSAGAYSEIRQLPRFTEFQTGVNRDQQSPIQTGQLAGRLKDFIVFRSQLVPTVSGTTYNIAFASDAIALVVRPLDLPLPGSGAVGAYAEFGNFGVRVVYSYQHGMLGQMFSVDVLYGVGVLRQSFGISVLSA